MTLITMLMARDKQNKFLREITKLKASFQFHSPINLRVLDLSEYKRLNIAQELVSHS